MLFEDCQSAASSFAKDPCVVAFQGRYYLYYTKYDRATDLHGIGIAVSDDLTHFDILGMLTRETPGEVRGICAPGAIVLDGVIHLFYQSYGQFPRDYICHATSTDGVHFDRDPGNPVFQPQGEWNCGRAIDADVVVWGDRLLMYFATRDPALEKQLLGVAAAPLDSSFTRGCWTQLDMDAPILQPELPWEQLCIEAPAACVYHDKIYLFYAGAYNCCPQQIGCAVSTDALHYTRLFTTPLLPSGPAGSWNESESGHPYIFEDNGVYHLFYQGSDDKGKTWRLSRALIRFDGHDMPYVVQEGCAFR